MKIAMNGILDRLCVVLGAFLFALFPVFIQQYQHQLIGHVNELQWQIDTMSGSATKSGKNLDQYIQKFIDHPDQDFSNQGDTMRLILNRWNKLSKALSKLQKASILTRPIVFISFLQWDIFKSTAKNFQPGVSFTLEGLFYIFLGMISGYVFFHLLEFLGKQMLRGTPQKS